MERKKKRREKSRYIQYERYCVTYLLYMNIDDHANGELSAQLSKTGSLPSQSKKRGFPHFSRKFRIQYVST